MNDVHKVRVHEGVFEALADRVDWGEPDEEGFYTPTLYRETERTAEVEQLSRTVVELHDALDQLISAQYRESAASRRANRVWTNTREAADSARVVLAEKGQGG